MFYATSVVDLESQEKPEVRQKTIESEIGRMARDRARLERAEIASHPGLLVPPAGQESHGDLVIVMVDEGRGKEVEQDIARYLKSTAATA